MIVLSYLMGQLFALSRKQSITIGIEAGIQNGTLGIFVAATLLKNPTMAVPSAIYSLLMFATGFVEIAIAHKLVKLSI